MKNLLKTGVLFLTIITVFSCSNTNISDEQENINKEMKSKDELNEGVVQKIFTLSDFEMYSEDKNSVVNKLSEEVISEFKKGMVFRDGIVISAKYAMVERELSSKDNEDFWLLFGMSKLAYEDYKEYMCSSPHNCSKAKDYICLTGC